MVLNVVSCLGIGHSCLTDGSSSCSMVRSPLSTQDIPVGSPQGSSISALLFILFINDLANVSNNTECPMFADDTSIFCFGSNLNQFYTTMNNQLKIHCKWFNANKLSIFANKTNYIIFHKSRQNVYNDN